MVHSDAVHHTVQPWPMAQPIVAHHDCMHPKVLAHNLGQGAKGQGPRWATLVALCGANLPPFG